MIPPLLLLTGPLKILGDLTGETKDMLTSLSKKKEKEFAESNNMLLIPYGTNDFSI